MGKKDYVWSEGKGLVDGWPDIDWTGTGGPIVIYSKIVEETEYDDNFVVQRRYKKRVFTCKVQWGGAFKHVVYREHASLLIALQEALEAAEKEGCPPEWVDRAPYIDHDAYEFGDDF